ncbi:diguanylate cyclase [Psychrobacillus sp. PGGUH221]|uniref:sensor domain-containing diguanylate cyclase n=1 Tax=Psychrobacillus sp. PGGUH221 TaxID=3020058 RepID=UPI0035C76097
MKYRGRIIGLLMYVILEIAFNIYYYVIYGYLVWIPKLFSVPLIGCFVWWLGSQYDKVQYFAERDRLQTNELKISNDRFRTIYEKAGLGIVILNQKGRIVQANPKLEEILGYDTETLCTMTFIDTSYLDENLEKNIQLFRELMEGKIDYYQIEKRYIHKDGHIVWGKVTSSRYVGDNEQPYVIGMMLDTTERRAAEEKLLEVNKTLEDLSNKDGLTGIANRRSFNDYFVQVSTQVLKNSTPLSLILLDIDYFKNFNDTYGHLCGDFCLKQVASTLDLKVSQKPYFVARYGGEEFVIVLPEVDIKGACVIAENIRAAVENIQISHTGSKVNNVVTVSVGVAAMPSDSISVPEDLVRRADEALYRAKQQGRNRIEC